MAQLTHGTGPSGALVEDGSTKFHPQDFTDLVDKATVASVGALSGEVAAEAIASGASFGGVTGTAATTTPALRKLGTGANDAAAGNAVMTANALKFGGNTAIALSSTQPTTNHFLKFDGTNIIGANPSSSAAITGTGTITTTSGSAAVVGTGTKFTTELKVGYLITTNSVTWRVLTITDDTHLAVNAAWGTNNTTQAYTYIQGQQPRPWNDTTAKSVNFTVAVTDSGQLFRINSSGGNIVASLVAANGLTKGDSVAFIKITDDANTVTITCAGGDTFTDGSTTVVLTTFGATATIVAYASTIWDVVSSRRLNGEMLQYKYASDAIPQTVSTTIAITDTPTVSNTAKIMPLSLILTPHSLFTRIRVRASVNGGIQSQNGHVCIALFSTVAAVPTLRQVVSFVGPQGWREIQANLETEFTTDTTSPMTLDIYIGVSTNNFYYLGTYVGGTLFGSTVANTLTVEEICI